MFEDTPESPLEQVCVALDLETTGVDPERDEIIEIGAVKFQGDMVLGTFQTLVNPRRQLPDFIKQLTGITQREVDGAPPLSAVAGELTAFLSHHPIVGHSISFDLAFLSRAGLSLSNPYHDTMELASVLYPNARGYALTALADMLDISYATAHRALEDAAMSHRLYVALQRRALESAWHLMGPMRALAERSPWALRGLLRQLEGQSVQERGPAPSTVGLLGVNTQALRERLPRYRSLQAKSDATSIDPLEVRQLLGARGPLAKAFPGYELRPQQVQMAEHVARSFNDGVHLMVEAGTGVGKSVAYLLPAILHALRNGRRVVVSTNTINLQEQLITKDLPNLVAALSKDEELRPLLEEFRFCHLKGRSNYLCFRRWAQMAQAGSLSADEARMACKAMVWLQDTDTGDRTEMNIPQRDSYLWDRFSAAGAEGCEGRDGVCFVRAARSRAEGAHLVVVNHALLLSDLATGSAVIPEYDYLVIDEAHHLEEEASRQFGYEVAWQTVTELTARLGQHLQLARMALQGSQALPSRREQLEGMMAEATAASRRLEEAWGRLATVMSSFVRSHRSAEDRPQLRITRSERSQPAWSEVEIHWDGFNEGMTGLERLVDRLVMALEPMDAPAIKEAQMEMGNWQERAKLVRAQVEGFVSRPDEGNVYWVTLAGQEEMPVLTAAPLDVGPLLEEKLFAVKASIVLTSATLSVAGTTKYLAGRIGFSEGEELLLGSPFDYQQAALVLVCPDISDPRDASYQQAVQDAVLRVARASVGGVLVLFTAHSALRNMRRAIKPVLDAEGMLVLAQGVDGSPRQVVEQAQARSNVVLLGTNSLWEGVDVPGYNLRVVVVTRLPFNVPTEPLFAARAELYSDSFNEYTVPQAVLRFRQGFGRLIRSKDDRGVVVVLDSRVQNRGYGRTFLSSLPKCTVHQSPLRNLGNEVATWLAR
ncbi:MAG: 3'-5' exoribonuclease [Chloroflexi bacterium]|nr:3'-5' exoribonuclease [Chloroflexota bacterium]